MTSSAGQHSQNPAPSSNTAPAAPSYASAAGASKKPATTPVIASGTNPPPVAVGSSAAPAQHASSASLSSVNGRPPITPAVPTVAHGSGPLNGAAPDHVRSSSVTISAAGPPAYGANGAPKAGIQFGFSDSPTVAHSTPQPSATAPIAIPGTHHRVPSPAQSPSPIPQPSASGGKPPAVPGDGGMKFGSFTGDGDRHPKPPMHQQGTPLGSKASPHARADSMHSTHSDMGAHGQTAPRGGFSHQGRGRGFNQPPYGQNMGFPPGGQYPRGPQGGRGNMPAYGQGRGMPQYPSSPQPPRASPALQHAMPHHPGGTPNMSPAMPLQGYPGQPNFPPPMGQMPPYPQGYNYAPHYNAQAPLGFPNYPQMPNVPPYVNPPNQSPSPGFQQPYTAGQYPPPAAAAAAAAAAPAMSRNSSQISAAERPASSTGPNQPAGTPQGTPQLAAAQHKPASSFVKPGRKNAAIIIKNAQGEALDLEQFKGAPASPASSIQQSKTPPAEGPGPTPPPQQQSGSTPSHGHSESISGTKTAEQLKKEFQEQVRKTAEGSKNKDDAPKKAEPEKTQSPSVPVVVDGTDKAAVETKTEPAPAPAAKPEAEPAEKNEAEPAEKKEAEPEAKAPEPGAEAKTEAQPKAEEAEPKKEPASAAATDSASQPSWKSKDPSQMTDEELDAMFAEMEAEDKKREEEQAVVTAQKKAEAAEAKKQADAQRAANADENDRKLREQEREMERLEEEKEKKREAEAKGVPYVPAPSAADALASKIEDLKVSDKKEADSAKVGASDKRGKPSALNLNISTKPVEPPQPSAALQSLKSARFLTVMDQGVYPVGVSSPNPALNAAVAKKGKTFKYDAGFLLQFQKVFTEQPSVEFNQQVKALIGDNDSGRSASARTPAGSGRQNSRGGQSFNAGGMGTFGAGGAPAKTLPSGTTSDQRFAMSNGQLPRPANPMPGFSRPGGAFPGGSSMSRTPSGVGGAFSNSGRQGSRSTRGGSRRDGHKPKDEAAAAKTMPLTAGMDIKPIAISSTGWKPMSLGQNRPAAAAAGAAGSEHLEPDVVQRKVKAALNKMTPEKFDRIADQILEIAGQSKNETDGRTLRQVIQLTFEKATDEAHWASMYAKFCKRMLETMSPDIRDTTIKDKAGNVVSGGALFRKYLLNRCQEEFERGWQTQLPDPKEGEAKKPGEAELMSDEYYIAAAAKRRGLGLVQFIGELYKLGMLTERIMHECVKKLVDYEGMPDEAEVESLSKLLRTIGGNLDNTDRGKPMMDAYFQRIEHMVAIPDLPSRLQFMLMDVVDLRRAGWFSKETNKGPKTLEEIRADAEAAAAQKAAEASRSNQRGAGGRPMLGRGDARGMSYNQPAQNQIGMDDLRRLKGAAGGRTSSRDVTLGPTSMFSSRSNSGRKLGPGGSLGRGGDDSGPASRVGTPPVRDTNTNTNAFAALANMDSDHPGSPPSTSPALTKAAPASGSGEKKAGE